MTNRERIQAIIHGRELDRVPFLQYHGLVAPNEEVWAALGRDKVGIVRWSGVHRLETPNCRSDTVETIEDGVRVRQTTLTTPAGLLVQEHRRIPESGAYSTQKHFVRGEADYAVLTAYLRDIRVVEDLARFQRDQAELGDDGLAMITLERTPYQQAWVRWTGLERLCVDLADGSPGAEECLSLWADVCRRVHDVVAKALETLDADYVNFPDNIAAPVIGRRYFAEYCVPLYREMAGLLEAHGLPLFCHMDGNLRALRDAIRDSGVRGIDSFTPLPDGDTRVGEALEQWPEMRLFVNFPSSVHLLGAAAVHETAAELLEQGGASGRLAIQISEDIPPEAWRTSFPAILRAIDEFGRSH